jgi:hypothetical protein
MYVQLEPYHFAVYMCVQLLVLLVLQVKDMLGVDFKISE